MTVMAWMISGVGLWAAIAGGSRWRSGGRALSLYGVALAGFGAFLLLPESVGTARLLAPAVSAIAAVGALASMGREVFRRAWLPLTLAGGAMAMVVVSEFVLDETSRLQLPVLMVLGALTLALMAFAVFRTIPELRRASRAR